MLKFRFDRRVSGRTKPRPPTSDCFLFFNIMASVYQIESAIAESNGKQSFHDIEWKNYKSSTEYGTQFCDFCSH